MSTKLSGPMIAPEGGKPDRLVVLLHGYGSDGNDMISLAEFWQKDMENALFVAPNAPEKCTINPMGYQWFALDTDRDMSRLNGSEKARAVLDEFLADLWRQTGLGPADTLVIGFSQGAMMALDVGLRLKETLLGIVAFSGALIDEENLPSAIKSRPPVCLVHGDSDDVVPAKLSEKAAQILDDLGVGVAIFIEPGVGHTISMSGLGFCLAFVRQILNAPQQEAPEQG
ncbi:Phospholipase/carboxylesterase family protein [hydrothermal vent metagenome]|uniref:Phospholipase/carboxylesterase family protein n=1 Tax=hydrothermal vent metagenome TaxID=652676 RepID=A0A3B0ULY5_9ZZZZ